MKGKDMQKIYRRVWTIKPTEKKKENAKKYNRKKDNKKASHKIGKLNFLLIIDYSGCGIAS